MTDKLLLRPAEAAELLGIGRSMVYEMISSGALPSVRVGSLVRVPADALHAWVQKRVGLKKASKPARRRGAPRDSR